ncbi:MAG TPA: DUF3786 domain-containing protein [Thermodesulfovibrionales bacterium]|nr:DUF3786 domain-containing protein [Thermodesulfovibrionales bacterium]
MNPLAVYKLLPKTNCGECPQKTCMAFAVALKVDPDVIGGCRYIGQEKVTSIKAMLVTGDWREELIKSLSEEVSKLDFGVIAADLGAHVVDGRLLIRCIGVDHLVGRDGAISPDRENRWIKILLLHYVRNKGRGGFTGRWISFSEMKGGFVKASSFARECEEPLEELMKSDFQGVSAVLSRLGASPVVGYPADYASEISLLPRVKSLIIYRGGDEEFPPSLNILFDAASGHFLDVESIMFLCEGLVHTVTMLLREHTSL